MYVFPFVPGGINNWITLFFVASEDSMDRCRSVHKTKSERTAFINPRHWIQSPGNWHSGCQTWVDQDRWGSKNFTVFLFLYLLSPILRSSPHISMSFSWKLHNTPPPKKKVSLPAVAHSLNSSPTVTTTNTDSERADTVWIDISKLLPSYSWVRHTVGIQASRLHVIRSITLLLSACVGLNTISCHHEAEGGPLGLTTAFNVRCDTLSLFSIEDSRLLYPPKIGRIVGVVRSVRGSEFVALKEWGSVMAMQCNFHRRPLIVFTNN